MLSKLLSYSFWFQTGFVNLGRTDKIYLTISALLLLVGIAIGIFSGGMRDRYNKLLARRWMTLGITIGLCGLAWSFLRFEAVQSISAHIVAFIIYAAGLVWAYFIVRFWLKDYRVLRAEHEKEQLRQKYL